MKARVLLGVLLTTLALAQAIAAQPAPPNTYAWEEVVERLSRAQEIVLISVEVLDDALSDTLTQLGYSGVNVYLLTNDRSSAITRLGRSGAVLLGGYAGPLVIVDESVFAYVDEYEAFVEAPSGGLAALYLKQFGVAASGGAK